LLDISEKEKEIQGMKLRTKRVFALTLIVITLSCTLLLSNVQSAEAQLPLPPGVPRGDVLVLENHWGTYPDPQGNLLLAVADSSSCVVPTCGM